MLVVQSVGSRLSKHFSVDFKKRFVLAANSVTRQELGSAYFSLSSSNIHIGFGSTKDLCVFCEFTEFTISLSVQGILYMRWVIRRRNISSRKSRVLSYISLTFIWMASHSNEYIDLIWNDLLPYSSQLSYTTLTHTMQFALETSTSQWSEQRTILLGARAMDVKLFAIRIDEVRHFVRHGVSHQRKIEVAAQWKPVKCTHVSNLNQSINFSLCYLGIVVSRITWKGHWKKAAGITKKKYSCNQKSLGYWQWITNGFHDRSVQRFKIGETNLRSAVESNVSHIIRSTRETKKGYMMLT